MDIARRYRIAVCLKISEYLQAKKKARNAGLFQS